MSTTFADSIRMALRDIERNLPVEKGAFIPGLGEDGTAERIADDFIFFWRMGRPMQNISAVQVLQLQEVLIDYFAIIGSDGGKHKMRVFSTLFTCRGPKTHYKVELLCKIVSTAIALKTKAVLDFAGAWMKEQHYSSPECIQLAQHVVHDYCMLVPGATSSLQELPKISPPFTCNFITAITHLYRCKGSTHPDTPPKDLLELITEWISKDSSLVLHSVLHSRGEPVESPLPGLISWCIYAPIFSVQKSPKSDTENTRHISQLYSKLFLGVLNSLLLTKTLLNAPRELLPCAVVRDIVESILSFTRTMPDAIEHDCVQVVLERLGQVLQVSMVTMTISANKATLQQICSGLPQNRLLQVILQ